MAIKSAKDFSPEQRDELASKSRIRSGKDSLVTQADLERLHSLVQNRINSWSSSSNDFYKYTQDYYKNKNRDESAYGLDSSKEWKDTASYRASWIQQEADSINKLLTDYEQYFDSEWLRNVRRNFRGVNKSASDIVTQADKDIDYWKQFKNENDYHNYYYGNKYKDYTYTKALEASKTTEGKEANWLTNNADLFMNSREAKTAIDGLVPELDAINKRVSELRSKVNNETISVAEAKEYALLGERQEELTAKKKRLEGIRDNALGKELKNQFLTGFLSDDSSSEEYKGYVTQGDGLDSLVEIYRVYGDQYAISAPVDEAAKYARAKKFADYMEEDEYNNYLYFLGKYGTKVANEYLDRIEGDVNTRKAYKDYEKRKDDSGISKFLFGLYTGLEQFGEGIDSLFNDDYKAPSTTQITSSLLREDMNAWEGTFYDLAVTLGNQAPTLLLTMTTSYLLGPSGYALTSAKTAGTVGQIAGATLMGTSAAGNAKQEMLNLGYSEGQANLYGAITGASEALLQYGLGGIGKLGGAWTDDAVKSFANGLNTAGAKFAVTFGADIAGEAIEESLQEALSPFFRSFATGETADEVDLGQVAYAGMLGALSAGVMNGLGAGANRVSNLVTAHNIKKQNGWADSVKKIGNTFSADTLAYKLAGKVDNNTSTWKLATLIKEMNGTLSEQNKADIKYQLMREGVTESDAKTISEWLGKAVDGENFTALQRKALDNNPIIEKVFKNVVLDQNSTVNQRIQALMDIYGKSGKAGVDLDALEKSQSKGTLSESATFNQFVREAQRDAETRNKNKELHDTLMAHREKALAEESKTKRNPEEWIRGQRESFTDPFRGSINHETDATLDNLVNKAKDAAPKVSESGATTDVTTGKQINIKRVTETDGKTATYALADGSTISNKNVEYADNDEGLLYEGAIRLGYDTDITNAVIHGFKGVKLPATTYLNGVEEALEYGRIGYPMDKISTNGFYADLPDSMKTYAYNLGKESAKKDTAKAQAKIDANKGKVEKAREGEVVHLYEKSGLTPRQKASIEAIERIVPVFTHNKVYIFDTVEKIINGQKVRVFAQDTAKFKAGTIADNGFINKDTGEIYIDLNAGTNGEGVILWTLAHELTHFVRSWSPAKFNVLADFLVAEYGKQGTDVRDLVHKKMANSKRRKLSYDEAFEEVVADAMQTMFTDTDLASKLERLKHKDTDVWEKLKQFFADLFKRITKAYKNVSAQTEEAQKLLKMSKETIERISDLFAEGIVDAGNTYANLDIKAVASGEVDIDGNKSTHAMSIRSMVEGVGLSFEYDEKTGQMRVLDMYEGTEVTSVTKEQVKDSPLGNIVSLAKQNGFISDAEASKQYGFLAELVNLCLNYKENFTMVWEIAGTQVFSAIKANSDTQYGKTIDFSTVCKKTQQVINVISETQKRLKRGLTKDEIKNIVYYETGKAGEPTPCPVCYVFSRWMGIGGILQQMSDFQKKYEGATEEDMRNFINDVESEIIKHANTPNKSGKLKGEFFDKNGKPKFGTVIADLKAKANSKIKSADIRLKIQETETLLEKADIKDKAKLQKTLNRLNSKLAKEGDILDAKLKEAEALLSRYEEYQWLTKTYMDEVKAEDGTHLGWQRDENFKPVDEDVLWDLREGARFATEFPKSWLYRTTKGCNAGKAILPYSDARVGETIQGVAYSNVKDITIGENNAFLNGDTKAQADYVTRAIKKQLAQNLIGGMRYQSTSDFRYEYGSDYLITFLEMQAIGAKVQLYTKVIEAVDFLCTMGAEVNLSVMPLNDGYIELADGRKQLVFSSVTGINAEAAIAKTKQYDNAQLILVGISDEHIRLALEGDDVNGDVVTFVIPFHGSGNTVKAIQELMDLLGEDLDVTKAQDYSLVQTDHFAKNRTAEQIALWDLRKKIISRSYKKNGNTVSWDGVLTSAEEALLNSENGRKYLKDLYNRFYVDKNADEFGVSLSTAQAEQIFPYEYWDKSLTYAEADQNGERFKDYCATMGIVPRFSGVDSSGKALGYGDFTNNKGYWKLLIDRKMYNNDGTYHAPHKINVTNFKAETLNPAWGSATYGDVMQKDTNPKKTNAITENVIRQIEAKAKDNFMFSVRNIVGESGTDYGIGVYLDSTLLTNLTEDERVDMVKEYLKELGGSAFTAYDSNGKAVDVHIVESHRKFKNASGRRVFVNKHMTNYLKNPVKQEAIALVDELILTAKQGTPESAHHSHDWLDNNGQNDWDKWTTYIQDKENSVWRATLQIANSTNGEKILYDIHPIEKVEGVEEIDTQSTDNRIAQNPDSVNTSDEFSFSERNSNATDNRTLLANALESVAQNDVERSWLSKYKLQIEKLNDAQNKLAELRAEIHKIRFSKGQDRKKLPALENQADILAERINRADKKLLNLEASKPLQNVIDRERAKAYKLGMEKLANYRKERAESKALNYYRPRIEKIVSDLSNRLEHPSAKTAIPEAFGASVAKVLSAFNFTTYDKDGNIRPTKANVKRTEAKRDLETLAELLGQNTLEAEYGQLDIPPEMLEWIKSVATYFDAAENLVSNEFDVNKMNEEQLKGAYKFLRSLQTAINNAGKYYTNAHYNVTDDARSTMEYVGELPTEVNETLQKASKMFKWDFASPVTVFDRFGEGGKHVYSMLVKGQSKMAYNVQEVLDFVEKAYTEKEAKEWREKLVTVEIGGEEFNVTVEMLMGLHCLLRQEDSKRHILEGGGIRFADVKNKGKVKRYENIFFNEIDAMAVEKALDEFPRAREVAEAMQKFMESTGSAWGNEVSMIRFGYHAFTTRNYYPIRTIAAGSEYEAQQKRANIYALLNKSFTKERNVKANNAVIVDGIFSVFNNHMAEMALYNAWALPVIDTIKWFNYSEMQDIDAKKPEKSVHETFRLAYGTHADEYVRRLLESINSQTDGGLSEGFAFRQLRMVNRVAVSWNVRVALQQPFSVARAYELINPKYVTPLVGKARDVAYEEMLANSGIAKWKSMGYYDVDVSRPLETQVMKNASVADKFTEVGMKAAEDGDSFTWTALWNACKKETAEKNPGLDNTALLEKTAERFNDIILRTQVVDSVLAKSQWMRSKNFLHRSTSAFMSEPLTSYNTLLRQADKFARDKAIHGVKYAVKNNAKGIAKVTSVFVFAQLLNALITAPLDALRDDDDYETYIEKLLANFKENAVGNLMPWNMMPWISDVADYFMYGRTDRSDMAYLVNIIDLSKSIYKLADNYSYYKLHNTFNKALAVASQTSGFSVSNIWRDAVALWNAVAGELGYGELKFQTNEDTHSEGYKRMYDAIASGDEDRAGYLFGQLLSNGVDEDKIYNGLTKCVKEAFQDGNISEEEATKLLKDIIGFVGKTDSEGNAPTDDDIYWMIDRWKHTEKEGYSRYDDLYEAMENGDPTSALEWHIEKKTEAYLEEARREAEKDGKTFSETKAKREAKAKAESAVKSAISSYWKPKYKEAYKKGDTEEMKRIRYILRDTKLYGSVSDILNTCKGWLKD